MELIDLRSFVEIARCSSFTHAAERLYVSQPTLSQRIKRLEGELGTKLFVREPQSVSLTDEGRLLLPEAAAILGRIDNLPSYVGSTHGATQATGYLRLGAQEFIDDTPMLAAIQRLGVTHPGITVEPADENITDLLKNLERGKFDAGFFIANSFLTIPGVTMTKVTAGEMRLLVPRGGRFDGRDSVHISELAHETVVIPNYAPMPMYYDFIMSQCISNGFMMKSERCADNANEVLIRVASGKGVGFLHSLSSLTGRLEACGVRTVGVDGADLSYDYVVAYRPDNANPALAALLQELGIA